MGLSTEEKENGFYAGIILFLVGLFLLGVQVYWFLRYGEWTSMTVISLMKEIGNPARCPLAFSPRLDRHSHHFGLDFYIRIPDRIRPCLSRREPSLVHRPQRIRSGEV